VKRNAAAGFGLVLLLFLGMALSGTAGMVAPEDSIHASCMDGVNNDGDQGSVGSFVFDVQDNQDVECVWMPFKFGQGEYDGLGISNPDPSDVAAYVSTWANQDAYPNYFDALVSYFSMMGNAGDECGIGVQNAMTEYRDTYNLPESKTGLSMHQAHCGVSY